MRVSNAITQTRKTRPMISGSKRYCWKRSNTPLDRWREERMLERILTFQVLVPGEEGQEDVLVGGSLGQIVLVRGRQGGAQGWHNGGRRPRHHDRRRAQRRQRQPPARMVERIVRRRRRRAGTRQRGQRGDRLHRRRHGQIDATQQHGTTPARAGPAAHRREDPATPRQWCVRQVQLQYKSGGGGISRGDNNNNNDDEDEDVRCAPRHEGRLRAFSIDQRETPPRFFSLSTFQEFTTRWPLALFEPGYCATPPDRLFHAFLSLDRPKFLPNLVAE